MAAIVDAHQHFWSPTREEYPWMTDELAAIRQPFWAADLRPSLQASGVDRTIVVQTRSSFAESQQFLALAEATDFAAGVVAWVDLTDADVAERLAELRTGRGGRFLVGIRHQVHDEADPDWLGRPDVRRGLAEVEAAGLVFDLLVRTREMRSAVAVAQALPGLRFVVDHLGKPPIRLGELEPWSSQIAALASLDNVSCKLSGLVTEAAWDAWTPADLRPYVDRALELFGPARLLFGSDWPVCLLAASYADVVRAARECLAALSPGELELVFAANASQVYGLSGVAESAR